MSAALERVIAEQQSEIDRLHVVLDQRFRDTVKNNELIDRLAFAVFRSMDKATMVQADRDALRAAMRSLNYCTTCEQPSCECQESE